MLVDRIRWHRVIDDRVSALQEGGLVRAVVASKAVCFIRSGGVTRAVLDHCPHQGKSFQGGWCEEGFLVCPWHRFQFDPATGRSRHGTTTNLTTFPVEVRLDGLYIGFEYTTVSLFGWELW